MRLLDRLILVHARRLDQRQGRVADPVQRVANVLLVGRLGEQR